MLAIGQNYERKAGCPALTNGTISDVQIGGGVVGMCDLWTLFLCCGRTSPIGTLAERRAWYAGARAHQNEVHWQRYSSAAHIRVMLESYQRRAFNLMERRAALPRQETAPDGNKGGVVRRMTRWGSSMRLQEPSRESCPSLYTHEQHS